MTTSEFDFIEGEGGGQFVLVGGPLVQLRQLLARGEVDAAVRLYEDTGAAAREQLMAEAETASFDTKKGIAMLLRRSRDFTAAARVFRSAKLETDAAATFEQAGEFAEAAACWARAGELLKAAACHERVGDTDAAISLYGQAGAADRAAECLARGRRFLEAARAFRALGNAHAEFEALRAGLVSEPGNPDIVGRVAEVMLQQGRAQQAAQLLVEAARRTPAAMNSAPFLQQLAAAFEGAGNAASGAKVRERLAAMPPSPSSPPVVTAAAPVAHAAPQPVLELGADAYGFLKALPFFSELSLPDMKALYRVCSLHTFAAGQHLIEPGHPGRGLFLMVEGQVEVFAGAASGSRLLNTVGVGGHVGEISLVRDEPTSARVTARTPVKALFISRDAFHQFTYGAPAAALHIYRLFTMNLAERVRVLSAAV